MNQNKFLIYTSEHSNKTTKASLLLYIWKQFETSFNYRCEIRFKDTNKVENFAILPENNKYKIPPLYSYIIVQHLILFAPHPIYYVNSKLSTCEAEDFFEFLNTNYLQPKLDQIFEIQNKAYLKKITENNSEPKEKAVKDLNFTEGLELN